MASLLRSSPQAAGYSKVDSIEMRYAAVGTDSGSEGEPAFSPSKTDDDEPARICEVPILSKGRLVLLNVAWSGMMMSFLVLAVAVVPSQVQYLVGSKRKAKTLSIVAAAGSLVTLLTAPLIGYFSDRLQSKYGRRKPFMVAGAVITCVCLIGVTLSAPGFAQTNKALGVKNLTCEEQNNLKPNCYMNKTLDVGPTHDYTSRLGTFILSYLVLLFGYTMVATTYNGLIADVTHYSVRGFSSGVMGLMMLIGNLGGAALGVVAEKLHVAGTYGVVAFVFFTAVMTTVFSVDELDVPCKRKGTPVFDIKDIFLGYIKPLFEHDFRWVFVTRFLMQMGIATTMGFLEYWFDDIVHLPGCITALQAVSIALLPLLLVAAICSVLGGILSDYLKRRKIIVIVAAVVMALSASVLTITNTFWLAVTMAIIFGIGLGSFISVDFAMVMDVLPSEADKAKDLAVWHQALVLPQLIATPIGGLILHGLQDVSIGGYRHGCDVGLGYIFIFAMTALYFITSAILVLNIRNVR
eukprot:scpid53674/ scgid15594/ 